MNDDLEIPKNLSRLGSKAYTAIRKFLKDNLSENTGGCKAFYSPDEWQERGEEHGTSSELVVVHDGGDLAYIFNLDYACYDVNERMRVELKKVGLFAEQCTSWYTSIHEI